MDEKLKKGQVIKIKNETYVVVGMIEFVEDSWIWQEYKIKSDSGKIKWLSIEEDEGKKQYSIYEEKFNIPVKSSMDFNFQNKNYSLFEKGTAKVNSYFGAVDVDRNEKVNFSEYISDDKKSLISLENWSGEVEKSIGEYVDETDVVITNEVRDVKINSPKKRENIIVIIVSALCLLVPTFLALVGSFLSSQNTLTKFLEKSADFSYVTSVTNNENNQKAKVYKTDLSIDEAVKKIIDGAPEKIKKVTDASDDDGIGIFTNYEYAYVYKSEDNVTYVQVSKKKYVTEGTNAYRSRYHTRGFYRTYTTNSTNSSYDSYLSSARQQSINSRKSSGGGTSSGK
ncbi:MAG: DUF4178 domain-containing protein [Clostridia bacterium]|nr:DUF4178 domain-containing protein [Clostridia bacterium]